MAQNKPLFIPWLRQQIDSGRYPGVNWVNQEHTQFSIPWKHALRQDSNSDDVLIFKAWAQTSANSDGQIQGDHSVWKRNFRSALRARGFTLAYDNKNDAANPHKVYYWPENTQSRGETGESQEMPQENNDISPSFEASLYLAEDDLFPDGCQSPDLVELCLRGLNIGGMEEVQGPVNQPLYMGVPPGEPYYIGASSDVQSPVNVFENSFRCQETTNLDHMSPTEGAVGGVGQRSPAEGTLALGQLSPLESAFVGTQDHAIDPGLRLELPVQTTVDESGCVSFSTHYNVIVYYKGKKVLEQLVQNDAGFQILPRADPNQTPNGLTVVPLPETDSILDQNQVKLTQDILNNLGGLVVRQEGGMLWSYRWGDSRVYWGLDKHEQGSVPRQLAKNNPEAIFSLKGFLSGFMKYMESGRESPSYSLFFVLGQQWPDPKNKPWEKKLIMIEVVLTALEGLKNLAHANGVSSMQSSELQISLEQMMEML